MNSNSLQVQMPPPALSRTSSSTSFSSDDGMSSSAATVISSSRRTRKRFTNAQLTMLENLFHQNSHPSREDRESVAKAGGMEIKSVTIWFQNKRQTERKSAASANGTNTFSANVVPNITSTIHTFSLHGNSQSTSRTASPPFSVSSRGSTSTTSSTRPSLDRVASRSELHAGLPRTPSRRQNTSGTIWDNMPSSPLAPPISPPAREFIDFGKRRTLEWACAAARLADKDGYPSVAPVTSYDSVSASKNSHSSSSSRKSSTREKNHHSNHQSSSSHNGQGDNSFQPSTTSSIRSSPSDGDLTDEADEEVITPPSTWDKDDKRWKINSDDGHAKLMSMSMTETPVIGESPKDAPDDDMFKAALALCGLGRRT